MRVAITGSGGLVGSALARRLQAAGHEVLSMRRGSSDDPAAVWNPELGWIRDGALEGVDAVVNLGGASIGEGRWTANRKDMLRRSRVDATQLLVQHMAALDRKPSLLVSASAVGFYGDRGDEELRETSLKGEGFLADLVHDWEEAAFAAEAAGIRVVAMRNGVVVDAGATAIRRLVLPFRFGAGGRLGSGRQWFPWISLDDLLAMIEGALTSELSGVVNAVAPEPLRNRDVAKTIGRLLSRPALFPVPAVVLRLVLGGAADELLLASQRVVPARFEERGFAFAHPTFESALRAAFDSAE